MDREAYIVQLTNGVPDHADPALKKYWLVTRAGALAIFLLFLDLPALWAYLALDAIGSPDVSVILIVAALTSGLLVVPMIAYVLFTYLEYEHYTFNVERTHLTISSGIFFKRSLTLPYSRVQGVTVVAGPLMRMFGISTVRVSTAGHLGIPGATIQGAAEPEIVRDVILRRVRELGLNNSSKAEGNGL